jgi:hypothetical protein
VARRKLSIETEAPLHGDVIGLEVGSRTMVPLDGETLEDLMKSALINIDVMSGFWEQQQYQVWLAKQPGDIEKVAKKRPPNRLYRLISDNEKEGQDAPMLASVVVGYQEGTKGGPALCAVFVLGIKSGAGSYETPIMVPWDSLEDVTEKARAGKLVFA